MKVKVHSDKQTQNNLRNSILRKSLANHQSSTDMRKQWSHFCPKEWILSYQKTYAEISHFCARGKHSSYSCLTIFDQYYILFTWSVSLFIKPLLSMHCGHLNHRLLWSSLDRTFRFKLFYHSSTKRKTCFE